MALQWVLAPDPLWVHLAVLCRLGEVPPGARFLHARTESWIGANVNAAFREALVTMLARDMVTFEVEALPDDLRPPPELAGRAGEEAQARAEAASHAVFVRSPNFAGMPPWGFWLAVSGARAAALELSGVVVDPGIGSVEPVAWSSDPPRTTVPSPLSHYVSVGWAEAGPDHITLETRGLDRLGLPDLYLADLPAAVAHGGRWLLLGAAWSLLRASLEQAEADGPGDGAEGRMLTLDGLRVGAEAMLRAVGDERDVDPDLLQVDLACLLEAGPGGGARVRLVGEGDGEVAEALRRFDPSQLDLEPDAS